MDVHLYLSCYYVSHLSLWVFSYLETGYYYLNMIIVMMEVFSMSLCTDVAFSVCFNNQIRSDESLSRVRLFATPWIAAHQASLSITNSWSLPKPMSIESVMSSNHLILCHPLLLLPSIPPSIRVFPMSQLFTWGGQGIGVSALASFLPKKSQGWSPSEWTGWISLQSKGLSRVFSNTTVQKHQFFSTQLSR